MIPTIENVTVIKRVKKRSINLDKIAGVNDVSRQIHNHQVDVYTAYDRLEQLQAKESDTFIKKYCPNGYVWFFCRRSLVVALLRF